jgi:rubrerythrin/CRISPR/Cas system-associated exonuclease Cas4 (RecB family)
MFRAQNGVSIMPRPKSSSSPKSRLVKPVGRLLDLAEINKKPSLLLKDVEKFLIDRIDQPNDRRQDVLHPSEMAHADWCPRASNYRLAGTKESDPQKNHGHVLENIFDEGHQIHDKWQRRMWDMGRLWGLWDCVYCLHSWYATSPKTCPGCGGPKTFIRYKEVPLDAEKSHIISGHEDGCIQDLKALVEIKSIGMGTLRMEDPSLLREYLVETVDGKKVYDLDGIWKGLKRPLPGHVRQTSIYMAIALMMGYDLDKIIFIYEYKSNQLTKEFSVKYNPRIAEPLLDQALDIKFALSKGKIVSRPPQFDKEKNPCKTCPFMSTCWGGSNEPSGKPTPEAEGGKQLGSGRALGRSREESVGTGSRPTRQAKRSHTAATPRPDRARRQRSDVTVQRPDGVADLHGGPASSVGGRREVRRRATRPNREENPH